MYALKQSWGFRENCEAKLNHQNQISKTELFTHVRKQAALNQSVLWGPTQLKPYLGDIEAIIAIRCQQITENEILIFKMDLLKLKATVDVQNAVSMKILWSTKSSQPLEFLSNYKH